MQLKIPKSQIYDIVKDMKGLTPNECPKEITYEMLVKEMDGGDLQALISAKPFDKKEMTNKLWRAFYIVFFTKSPFGFYNSLNDRPETDIESSSNKHLIAAIPIVTGEPQPAPTKPLLKLGELILS